MRAQSNLFWQFRYLIRKCLILRHFIGLQNPLQLLQVHRSLISTVTSTNAPFTNLHCDFYKCTVHKSPLQLLQVHRSPIYTVALLQPHHPAVNLHLLATILCDYATRRLSVYVIMLPINNDATNVNMLVKYLSAS